MSKVKVTEVSPVLPSVPTVPIVPMYPAACPVQLGMCTPIHPKVEKFIFWVGWAAGGIEKKANSVQLLLKLPTGTELGKMRHSVYDLTENFLPI